MRPVLPTSVSRVVTPGPEHLSVSAPTELACPLPSSRQNPLLTKINRLTMVNRGSVGPC